MSVQSYLRTAAAQGRELRRTRCFDVYVSPRSASPHSNYAIPHDGAEPGAADVQELVDAMTSARRLPRLEYLPATAPEAEAALLAGGFEVELRTPVMTATPDTLVRATSPATIERLDALADPVVVRSMMHVLQVAFGDEPDPEEPGLLRVPLAVVARVGDEVVGGGMGQVVAEGTTELAGIAVADAHRRQGIAGAITAELAAMAFEAGAGSAFLTPGDDGAQRVYARAGFSATDVMLHLRRATPAAPGR